MSAKKGRRKIETRTLLYISLVIVIIGGVYIFISNQPPEIKKYSPSYVKANSASFIESGETIIIEGYYDSNVEDGAIFDDYQHSGSGALATGLKLDASNVANFSEKLIENTKLRFTGHLEYIIPDPEYPEYSAVVFIASEITDSW